MREERAGGAGVRVRQAATGCAERCQGLGAGAGAGLGAGPEVRTANGGDTCRMLLANFGQVFQPHK